MRRLIPLLLALLLVGCPFTREPTAPIATVSYQRLPVEQAHGLIVLLPGVLDAPEVFADESVVTMLRELAPRYDAVAVDAHLGYYKGKENSIVERLRDDVIVPARRRGYRSIWLLGVSLGGFGALLYASRYPDHVSGIIALAPFLGEEDITASIRAAGGLSRWQPGDLEQLGGRERFFTSVWLWLQGYAHGAQRPPLYLGYGGRDSFAEDNAMLAAVLEPSHVMVIDEGGHDWRTFKALAATLARRAPLTRPPAP